MRDLFPLINMVLQTKQIGAVETARYCCILSMQCIGFTQAIRISWQFTHSLG